LPLKSIGLDTDNEIKPIKELSYKVYPPNMKVPGYEWTGMQPDNLIIPKTDSTGKVYSDAEHDHVKAIARSTVFRWYKVDLEEFKKNTWSKRNGFDGLPGLDIESKRDGKETGSTGDASE